MPTGAREGGSPCPLRVVGSPPRRSRALPSSVHSTIHIPLQSSTGGVRRLPGCLRSDVQPNRPSEDSDMQDFVNAVTVFAECEPVGRSVLLSGVAGRPYYRRPRGGIVRGMAVSSGARQRKTGMFGWLIANAHRFRRSLIIAMPSIAIVTVAIFASHLH